MAMPRPFSPSDDDAAAAQEVSCAQPVVDGVETPVAPAVVGMLEPQEEVREDRRALAPHAVRGRKRRRRDGGVERELLSGLVDVHPDARGRREPRWPPRAARDLAAVDQDVVRPLDLGARATSPPRPSRPRRPRRRATARRPRARPAARARPSRGWRCRAARSQPAEPPPPGRLYLADRRRALAEICSSRGAGSTRSSRVEVGAAETAREQWLDGLRCQRVGHRRGLH